ncbi:hypothetical protein EMEDMD4_1030011 [Sinorhizobium medicae]|uniref:Transmembrane protein n=1 Tax=Sinorhizobium medicae TaxID=110321 RepID=A0A508WPN6_9HYPH|nr:hypothetical protein EMEDMD4_1030011 [Sinorhizobium medicae]
MSCVAYDYFVQPGSTTFMRKSRTGSLAAYGSVASGVMIGAAVGAAAGNPYYYSPRCRYYRIRLATKLVVLSNQQ